MLDCWDLYIYILSELCVDFAFLSLKEAMSLNEGRGFNKNILVTLRLSLNKQLHI